eukprot:CAMPEP_0194478168 /NCGR_PEP_ID=MMETSP0253-20130528/1710_1 /TAXON_ID=2966 /ORGANISM="Noctiluca scintillans" /LENGTH=577 /DNA_ID=CAMNT_0039317233 /DNA_START=42 /DNA_END=1775 /DNA_ORIENTATION=+
MYRTGSLVCAACLWPRLVVGEYFEPHLKLEEVCGEGACVDQIILSLSLPSGAINDGQENSIEFPSVADSMGTVWTFVAPWTVKWTALATESIHKLTFEAEVESTYEQRNRLDKSNTCPVCEDSSNGAGFCCSYGNLRSAGVADTKHLMSQHCLISSNKWYVYSLEHDRTHYTFEVKINRPFRNTEGFLVDDETTWHIDSDRTEFVVTEPEDDPSSFEYSSHREVSAMSAQGFSGRYYLRPVSADDQLELSSLHDGMLLPLDFVDWSGLECATGIQERGFDAQSLYCDRDTDVCNEKQVQLLFDNDVILAASGVQPLYWIQGFCEGEATTYDVEEFSYINCPFSADLHSAVNIKMPVNEKDFGLWIGFVTDGTCSGICPDLYDVVCFVNNSCWRPIGIMFLTVTFICVGVCFFCYIIVTKQKALEQRVRSMRKSKEDRDALTSSTSGGSLGLSSLGSAPQMMSQCGVPTLPSLSPPVMSQYGVLPMETKCSQYGVPMQSQGGALPLGSQFGAPMQSMGGAPPMGSQFGVPMQSQGGAPPMSSQYRAPPMSSQMDALPMGSQYGSQPIGSLCSASYRGW